MYYNLLQNRQRPFTVVLYRKINLSCLLLRSQLGQVALTIFNYINTPGFETESFIQIVYRLLRRRRNASEYRLKMHTDLITVRLCATFSTSGSSHFNVDSQLCIICIIIDVYDVYMSNLPRNILHLVSHINDIWAKLRYCHSPCPQLCHRCQQGVETIRYDTRCYFNARSKADISQLNLPHGTDN